MKKNILVSGLGGSLFPYLHTKLVDSGFNMFYVDSNPYLKFIYSDLNVFEAPLVSSNLYKAFIKTICSSCKIDIYIPLIDEELITAIEIGNELTDLVVLAPRAEFVNLCLDKYTLMKKLDESNISKNQAYLGTSFDWQFPPPAFVKPNCGRGSRGIKKISNKQQLDAYYTLEEYLPSEILVQPFIDGVEYTVGVVANKKNKIVSISPRKVIQKKGITISAVTENSSTIEEVASKINELLTPQGPFNIQLFLTKENQPIIFEINPRFSTTLVLSYEAGLDEISLLINNYKNENVNISRAVESVYLYRRWENSFFKSEI